MSSRPNAADRILFVIESLGAGGAEQSLAELLPAVSAAGFAPTVVCLKRQTDGVHDDVVDRGFDVRVLPGSLARQVSMLRAILQRERFALVHSSLFRADLVAGLAALRTGTPVLSSLVNVSYDPIRLEDPNVGRLSFDAARAIDGWRGRHLVRHFHAISYAVKDAAVRSLRLDPGRITVIERGRDSERLGTPSPARREAARKALDLDDSTPVLLCVGRQEYQKGHQIALAAFNELQKHHPKALLLLAGRQGWASQSLAESREGSPARTRIRMLGHRADVPDLLAAADVFVFPSLYEGLGGAVLEAMALAVPVVASDLPALREVVEPGSTGLLVPRGQPAALAGAIASLLDDPKLASRLGSRGRVVFLERFTSERSSRRMIELYRSVAREDAATT